MFTQNNKNEEMLEESVSSIINNNLELCSRIIAMSYDEAVMFLLKKRLQFTLKHYANCYQGKLNPVRVRNCQEIKAALKDGDFKTEKKLREKIELIAEKIKTPWYTPSNHSRLRDLLVDNFTTDKMSEISRLLYVCQAKKAEEQQQKIDTIVDKRIDEIYAEFQSLKKCYQLDKENLEKRFCQAEDDVKKMKLENSSLRKLNEDLTQVIRSDNLSCNLSTELDNVAWKAKNYPRFNHSS